MALEIESDGSEEIAVKLPKGWVGDIPTKVNGKKVFYVQTTSSSAQGQTEVEVSVGKKKRSFKAHVVRIIK